MCLSTGCMKKEQHSSFRNILAVALYASLGTTAILSAIATNGLLTSQMRLSMTARILYNSKVKLQLFRVALFR